MKKNINGKIVEITSEEIAEQQAEAAERKHWLSTPYEMAVVNEIRRKYDINAELAIQRQRDEKPEEYRAYYDYCESCKQYVKEKQAWAQAAAQS